MNVAEFLISIFEGVGVDRAFSLTGGMAMQINRAVGLSSIQTVYCNHEQACVAAADGYSKINDYRKFGLAVVTSGPGVTNTLTALASAYHDSVPLILLAGQIKTADINTFGVRSHGAQEVPSLELVASITKAAIRYSPESIDDERLIAVLGCAMTGRKGPVFVEVPLDVQARLVVDGEERVASIVARINALEAGSSENVEKAPGQLSLLLESLSAAKRPVIFVGNGVRIAGIQRAFLEVFLDAWSVPVLTTWPSCDLFSGHTRHFGSPGGLAPTHSNKILQAADVVLFLGVRLDLLTTGFSPQNFGKRAKRFIVEIDPAEQRKFSGHSNTVILGENVRRVIDYLLEHRIEGNGCAEWLRQCVDWRLEDDRAEASAFASDSLLNSRNVARSFASRLTGATVVATASGFAIEGFARFFNPGRGQGMIYAGHSLGSMGLGLPTAIGAAAANGKSVVCVEADGGVMLNLQELLTLQANQNINLPIFILNNRGYLSISNSQRRAFGQEFGASDQSGLHLASFDAIAAAFGFPYFRVTALSELNMLLDQVSAGLVVRAIVDIWLETDVYRGPSIVTKFRDDGTPYSTDLEDVVWRVN